LSIKIEILVDHSGKTFNFEQKCISICSITKKGEAVWPYESKKFQLNIKIKKDSSYIIYVWEEENLGFFFS
jgi:hypothetical protein